MKTRKCFFVFFALLTLLFGGCASKVVIAEKQFYSFSQIDFESVRFRRPKGVLFDPEETKSARVDTTESFDCEKSEDFFSHLNLSGIGACLKSVGKDLPAGDTLDVDWKLNKESQPSLKLRDPEDALPCVREVLSEIPFPRELVFIAENREGESSCFSSRLALESAEWLGWELPPLKVRLRVTFPLRKPPTTDREVERLLRGWILSIFRGAGAENQQFHGRFLPTRYCLRCLGLPESTEHGPERIPPPIQLWPALDVRGKHSLR